jgi:hypothetical protein
MFKWLKRWFGMDDEPVRSDEFVRQKQEFDKHKARVVETSRTVSKPVSIPTISTAPKPQLQPYVGHDEAVIVACFFNPQNSPYRLLAFQKWYSSIKHLNHRIIECLIGDAESQLPESPYITQVTTDSLLWHKESLLNKVISELPFQYKYVFWLDTDVLFTNPNWLVEGVEKLQTAKIIQPFEYCVHLQKNQTAPDFDVNQYRSLVNDAKRRHPMLWRSFLANWVTCREAALNHNYDVHGHVGFAWGARREVLDRTQLYDKALIGGADHIIAHAATGQIPCNCISRAFTLDIDGVAEWSKDFFDSVGGKVDFVRGDLYHIWHGEVKDREYLKRIVEFAPEIQFITRRDANGLWIYDGSNPYMKRYYRKREVTVYEPEEFGGFDAGFFEEMGYQLADLAMTFGQPTCDNTGVTDEPQTSYNDGSQTVSDPEPSIPSAPAAEPVQSFTPAYEPGHWDYTPPGAEDRGSTFS